MTQQAYFPNGWLRSDARRARMELLKSDLAKAKEERERAHAIWRDACNRVERIEQMHADAWLDHFECPSCKDYVGKCPACGSTRPRPPGKRTR